MDPKRRGGSGSSIVLGVLTPSSHQTLRQGKEGQVEGRKPEVGGKEVLGERREVEEEDLGRGLKDDVSVYGDEREMWRMRMLLLLLLLYRDDDDDDGDGDEVVLTFNFCLIHGLVLS